MPDPVHGVLQVRILEWVAMRFSRELPKGGKGRNKKRTGVQRHKQCVNHMDLWTVLRILHSLYRCPCDGKPPQDLKLGSEISTEFFSDENLKLPKVK